jgi:CRP-like cAMP-binding protein
MSAPGWPPPPALLQWLARAPLFAGLPADELAGLAAHLRRRRFDAGALIFQQGDAGAALYLVEAGEVAIVLRSPEGKELILALLGPGDAFGELALLDGGPRSATVRALEPTRVLRLGRADFDALVRGRDASSRSLRRELTELACRRLRERHRALAASLPGDPVEAHGLVGKPADPPARSYLLRLPFLRGFEPDGLDDVLARARVERYSPGRAVLAEGERPRGFFVTLNGAVEESIRRGTSAIRVQLAGPGRGFGYASLLAGGEATTTAVARERSLVLVVDPAELDVLLSTVAFAEAVERDVVGALRQAERPQARLAASHS